MNASKSQQTVDINLLICPNCGANKLRETNTHLACNVCEAAYRTDSGKIFFTDDYFDVDNWESKSLGFDILKREHSSYRRIDRINGPRIRDLKEYLNVDGVALNLGSGKDSYDGYTNIDLGRYPNVHIVSSLEKIPYKDSSVDLLVSNSVLEHIFDYKAVIDEIYRVLKPGGYLYLCVPSLCMRHHDYDYHRWTMPGLLRLLNEFRIVEHGSCRGVAYAIDTLIEALIVFKTKPGVLREAMRRSWLFVSQPLFWIAGDDSPEYQAMSQTIYVIARKEIP
jgi:SAM-dependent methyltransferase